MSLRPLRGGKRRLGGWRAGLLALGCALAAVAGLSGCSGGGKAPSEAAPPQASAPRDDLPGLPNFAKVSSALYRGAQPTREGFQRLRDMGVRTVVNLRAFHSDADEIEGLGFKYVRISVKAWHAEDEDVVAFLRVVMDPANHPVFVHCQHGADRTGMMVATYRIVVQGWSREDALAELRSFGFHGVWRNLKQYVQALDRDALMRKVEAAERP